MTLTFQPRPLAKWVRRSDKAAVLLGAGVYAVVGVVLLPIAAIVLMAFASGFGTWPHLISTVLPRAVLTSLTMLAGVGVLTAIIGTGCAWVVTMYRFPGRAIVDRLLVLPLAIPTYIAAYAYADLLDWAGPVQTALRAVFGVVSPRDSWFPDIRSTGGAVFVLSAVLYPYVYLTARSSFVQQSVCALEVARTLGRTPLGVLRDVALPLARPAVAAGVALVMMEALNDLGAVQHLGVETLSVSIYVTWLQRGSLAGAVQLALVLLAFVLALLLFERAQRAGRTHNATQRFRSIPFHDLDGVRGWVACLLVLSPFVIGFVIPAGVLISNAIVAMPGGDNDLLVAMRNSLGLSFVAAGATAAIALFLGYAARVAPARMLRIPVQLAGLGYALPGTLLALGLIVPMAWLDALLAGMLKAVAGIGGGPVIAGSIAALVIAYVIRFLAVALGSVEAGLARISPSFDAAARTLGAGPGETFFRVHLPMLTPAIGAAMTLVFVDAMKELPATLLLRPFNFPTLATEVYNLTAIEQFEQAAFGALAIVVAGLIPVLLLHRTVAGGRSGG